MPMERVVVRDLVPHVDATCRAQGPLRSEFQGLEFEDSDPLQPP